MTMQFRSGEYALQFNGANHVNNSTKNNVYNVRLPRISRSIRTVNQGGQIPRVQDNPPDEALLVQFGFDSNDLFPGFQGMEGELFGTEDDPDEMTFHLYKQADRPRQDSLVRTFKFFADRFKLLDIPETAPQNSTDPVVYTYNFELEVWRKGLGDVAATADIDNRFVYHSVNLDTGEIAQWTLIVNANGIITGRSSEPKRSSNRRALPGYFGS